MNGRRLGVAVNGAFSAANTDTIPGGRLWNGAGSKDVGAARAWNDARAAFIAAGGDPRDFMPAGPISSSRDRHAQDHVWTVFVHGGPPAAPLYTSNHGWGLAVDVISHKAAAWLMIHGPKFRISWDEGRRVGEWWHFRYVGGYKPPRRPDGLAHMTRTERRWCRELDRLRGSRRDARRQRVLVRELTVQRKRIWREAQRTGWEKANRTKRYRSLMARTT